TYTFAGPTLKGVGTTTRWKNPVLERTARDCSQPAPPPRMGEGLGCLASLALPTSHVGPHGLVLPAELRPVVHGEPGGAPGLLAGAARPVGPVAPGKLPHPGPSELQGILAHLASPPFAYLLLRTAARGGLFPRKGPSYSEWE